MILNEYGYTRGKEYDFKVDEAFRYVFSNVIDHINSAFFIIKSNINRRDTLTKYIFSSVTNLFSDDVSENFIVLATFANKETKKIGPAFDESIQTDADFLEILKNMNEKWWYPLLDNRSILVNDKITIYSFKQAKELYEEKVKISRSIKYENGSKNPSRKFLNDIFVDLPNEQDHLQKIGKNY